MSAPEPWLPGPAQPPWPADQVHLWWVELPQVPPSEQGLSADELQMAARAITPALRDHRLRTRRVLRDLLGRYLGQPPGDVAIAIDAAGKPQLAAAGDGLCFNLSHSAGVALFAFSAGRDLGVDVQAADQLRNPEGVARSSFSRSEQAALLALPAAQQHAAVLHGWVRKEAYVKARGQGYGYGFKAFSVSLGDATSTNLLLDDEHDPGAQQRWWLSDVPGPLAAACCVQGGPLPCHPWRWSPQTPQGPMP